MKTSVIRSSAIFVAIVSYSLFSSCMNSPAESITSDSSNNEGLFDTTAAQIEVAPHDSLEIAVRDVISKYPGVNAAVTNGEVLLTGELDGKKVQYLITDINTLKPKKVTNKIDVIK